MSETTFSVEKMKPIRCPKLGHQIGYLYCRSENRGLPCSRVLICWQAHPPVEKILKEELSPEEWAEAFERPAPTKMASLLGLIEQAKGVKNTQGSDP